MNKTRRRKVKRFMRRVCAVSGVVLMAAGTASVLYAIFSRDLPIPELWMRCFGGVMALISGMAVHDQSCPPAKEWRPRYVRR